MNKLTQRPLLIAVIAMVTATPYLAMAQELEEIVVTAERRETTVLKTPISLEVFTADALAADQLRSVRDLENATANLTINTTGFTVQSVNIRGIGNSVVNPNIAPGVAVFQDGLLMAETVVLQQGFLDVATIEVLRGPQGTFVGQSSTGGAIRINAVRPDFDGISGFFDGSLGSKSDQKFSGAITLPLSDKISTRFAFNKETRDSYFRNIGFPAGPTVYRGGRQPGKVDDSNLRASILWEPNDKLSVLGRIELNSSNTDALAPYQPNRATYVNPNDPTGFGQAQYAAFALPGNDPYVIAWDMVNPQNNNTSNRYSIDLRRKFSHGIEFRSLTGYQHNDLQTGDDPDATTANSGIFINDVGPTNDYWSQEFNLLSPDDGKFTWIVGTSWFRRTTPVNIRSDNNLCGYNGATGIVTPCFVPAGAPPIQTAILTIDTTQQHAGLFGQLTWRASDKIELQFGARESWDHNSDEQHIFVAVNTQYAPLPVANCPDPRFTAVLPAQGLYNCFPVSPGNVVPYNDSTPTYKVGVNWTPTSNQLIYAFFARGYKSGGINNGLAFQPENVDDVEIGWKTSILDKRLQIQLGAFSMDYKNMQQPAFIVRPFGTGLSAAGAIQNIGSSTVSGVEASLNGAFKEFSFQFSVGYVNSDLGGITTVDPRLLARNLFIGNNNYVPGCNAGQVPVITGGVPNCYDYSTSSARKSLSGAANLYSPQLSYNFSLSYGFSLKNGAKLRPRASFAHVDESFASLFQTDNYFRIDERNLRNLSLTYEAESWDLQAFCNNCSDQHYIAAVEGGTGNRVIYGDPESIGLRFHKRF